MRRMLLLLFGFCLPLYLIGCAATTSVTRPITVTVSPTVASVPVGQTQAFIASVTGTPNTGVTWTLTEGGVACSPGCGTIAPTSTTSGTATTYTAPATPPAQGGAVTVTATSAADATKSASATVTITQSVSITISPLSANVGLGATQAFTATVTGTNNTGVTWTLTQGGAPCTGCGTITPSTASGAPATYTAPTTAPASPTVTVTATSVADTTKSASATVTLTQTVGITISPTTATVIVAQTQAFTATVTGTNNPGVTWTLSQAGAACSPGCGTIAPASTTSGTPTTYTAPATVPAIPNVTVTATSAADPTKSASATVTVTAQTTGVVTVSPGTATVEVFTTQQFTAAINGQPSTAVTWQVQLNGTPLTGPVGGGISSSGLYTAPHSISNTLIKAHPNGAPLTVDIVATSTANTANSGSATVTLTVPGRSGESAPIELGTSGSNALDFNTNGNGTTCCGGTLGSLVTSGGTQYIISADHVLARSSAGAPGEAILQPGTIDTNCSTQGTATVANLTQGSFSQQNPLSATVDAAIAQVVSGMVDSTGKILMLGNAVDSSGVPVPGAPQAGQGQAATVGLAVAKSGRTTGLTCSTVLATNLSTSVQYSTNCDGTGTIFNVTYTNQVDVAGGDFSGGGDSGSLIVTQSNATPVALLFAGSNTDTVGNPISDVLNFFASNGHALSFVGGNRGSGSTPQVIGCTLPGPQAAMAARLAVQKAAPSTEALAHATSVRDTHGAELLGHPEVQAVGVGASYDNLNEPAILLFVAKGQPRANLPRVLDGVRTRIVEREAFSHRGLLSSMESAALEQSAAPPQIAYSIPDAEIARAKVVHTAHVDELMKMDGVQGVGITSSVDSPGEAALMIFLIDGAPHATIPPEIDGVRTRIRVSSRFHAGLDGIGLQHSCPVARPKRKESSARQKPGSSKH